MARLQFAANTGDNTEGLEDFTPLPVGDYIAQITKSEYRATKRNDGNYLQLIWKIVSGKYTGRTIFDNLNLDNPNPIAVEIANKALNSICKACEKVGVQDSEELHGIPVKLNITVQKETTTNPAGNNIRGYKKAEISDLEGTVDTQSETLSEAAGIPTPPETQSGEAAKKLPWECRRSPYRY